MCLPQAGRGQSTVIYLDLLLGFLRVGCFAFGGAYGAIPLIRDVVLSYGWMNDEALTRMIAVSESTPGPIMVNLATYVGSSQAGIAGAAIATAAVVLPSFVILVAIVSFMKAALKNKYVNAALDGVKPCIIGIILATGIYMTFCGIFSLGQTVSVDFRALAIALILLAAIILTKLIFRKKLSPILLIIISAALGMIIY